ncbi:MAG TPA: glycosyltransferase family 2 protein [Solirubrobacterales bacterium]|jgi:dolichol-phosphate mannosyltransferase|nr:glycosyltransferase family 2 protein [Solirubrobacterales bacterium]
MKLSVVIPAHNEEGSVAETVENIVSTLSREDIDHDVLVIDDSSSDRTAEVMAAIAKRDPRVRCVPSHYQPGFGFAVRSGLELFEGDAVAIVMADGSDSPEDLVTYYRLLEEGYECAFGSRFVHGAVVTDYPTSKLIMNRIVNFGIRMLFRHGYNDTTNAFKAYRREVIESIQPLLSHHFNLTVELPLKAVVRGYSYGIVPISWSNRKSGVSKLALNEMGSRYLFIVLYVFLEHHLSHGDYRRDGPAPRPRGTWRAGLVQPRRKVPDASGNGSKE